VNQARSGSVGSRVTIRELTPVETALAHPAMAELRWSFGDRDRFVHHVDTVLRPEGYRLLAAIVTEVDDAVAVAGFRCGHSLAWGAYLYIDDLCTLPEHRRRGHAGVLLEWLMAQADRLRCDQVHLDSGTGAERFSAHRLYYNRGLAIWSHHFTALLHRSDQQAKRGAE
jgi:GNAT superfamily N-acetyltransferase